MKRKIVSTLGPLRWFFCTLLFVAGIVGMVATVTPLRAVNNVASANQKNSASKIAPWVMQRTADGKACEFLVVLADQADLSSAKQLRTKAEKGRYVRDTLRAKTQATQQPILNWLKERNIQHRSFYIVNLIWVKANREVVSALAARPDVLRIEGNPRIKVIEDPLPAAEATAQPQSVAAVEQGVAYSHAPEVWALGFTGQGIVVGAADTGYRWDHNALKSKYRGWNGTTASHDYNWHDSIHADGGVCGPDSPIPCDDHGHGTHTAGTAVGDDGGTNQVGMAPGAKWIGCRNMDQGNGTPATYLECFEFFLAPYPVGGTPAQGDSSKAPDVTTNSWTCPEAEGCSPDTLQAGVEAQRAAGIMMVVAAGNSGPTCSTVEDPPAIYDAAYTIAALNNGTDTIASFSSRGPVESDGSNRLKPDLAAPGTNVRSATASSVSAYANLSGTSMATPHVAGAVALLWSARPTLRHDIAATEAVLNDSAVHILSNNCGTGPAVSPNLAYGNGRLDIKKAVDHLLLTSVVSRKVHGAAEFDIPMPLTGEPGVECRTSGGTHKLVFTFGNNMMSANASVTSGVGNVSGTPAVSGKTVTVNLVGVADAQKITVTLSGATDTLAQVLPNTAVSLNILAGDTSGNKTVNSTDIAQTKIQSGAAATAANFREDVVVSGSIGATDVSLVKSHSGLSVP